MISTEDSVRAAKEYLYKYRKDNTLYVDDKFFNLGYMDMYIEATKKYDTKERLEQWKIKDRLYGRVSN